MNIPFETKQGAFMKNQNRMTQGDGTERNWGRALTRGTAAVSGAAAW